MAISPVDQRNLIVNQLLDPVGSSVSLRRMAYDSYFPADEVSRHVHNVNKPWAWYIAAEENRGVSGLA